MTQTILDITVSLDGYVAGPNPTLDEPLGRGGERLHEWAVATQSWRAAHGGDGGEQGLDDERLAGALERVGAQVMGRKMFSGGSGAWADDPNAAGWWGDDPPFRVPVFVVTHHAREDEEFANGTTFVFVTDGVAAAIARARESADGKDVRVAGGASVAQQALAAGLLDRLDLHIAPLVLGGGTPLFDVAQPTGLRQVDVAASAAVTHATYVPLADQ